MENEVDKLISNTQCTMPNAQFQIPEKSYTIMSYAGGQVGVKAEASPFIDDN